MTSRALVFAAKFILVSVPLTWIWIEWGRWAYAPIFMAVSGPIYDFLGIETFQGGVRERYINYIPFLVLMVVTPRLGWTRRIGGLLGGCLVIFVFQIAFNGWVQVAFPGGARTAEGGFSLYFPAILFSDALPLILWALICQDFVSNAASEAFEKWGLAKRD